MTNRKIAHTKKRTKRPTKTAEKPLPRGLIERAAERAGYNPAGFAPEEQAALDERRRIGLPVSEFGRAVVKQMREQGAPTEAVTHQLRHEARGLEELADRLTPSPEVRDTMLRDALEVLSAVESIYYVNGEHSSTPESLMREALRSAEQEFDLFSMMKESRGSELHWQELWRASYRAKLAWKLAEFRRKHPEWKPTKAETDDEQSEAVAS